MSKQRLFKSLIVMGAAALLLAGCGDPMKKAAEANRVGNYDDAVHWYEKAADKGILEAEVKLGFLYMKGRGPGAAPDYASAFKWLQKAALQGDIQAQGGLGFLYKIGTYGNPQNYAEATKWLNAAAVHGDRFAQLQLGRMYQMGDGVAKDSNQAFGYIQMAALGGDPDAMRSLGMMYQTGDGVAVDFVEADRWFLTAVAKGNDVARANSNVLQGQMSLPDIQEAQRRAALPLNTPAAS